MKHQKILSMKVLIWLVLQINLSLKLFLSVGTKYVDVPYMGHLAPKLLSFEDENSKSTV